MAFSREASVVPVKIKNIEISLFDPDPAGTEQQRARVSVQIVLSNGSVVVRDFNLVDHVSNSVINQLINLAATLRAKAVSEILPVP